MFQRPITILLFLLLSLSVRSVSAQMPAQSQFQSALTKIINDDPQEYSNYRGPKENGIYTSTLVIPGTHQNRIQGVESSSYVYYEAYIKEGMSREESIALEKQWRALITKSLPGYMVVGPTVIVKDFEKTEFTSKGTRPIILTLYRDINNDAFRLSFSIKALNHDKRASAAAVNARPAPPAASKNTSDGPAADDLNNMDLFKKNIAAIILARKNGFLAYRGIVMDGTKPGEKLALVTDHHFPGDPAGIEMIKIGADGKATYTVLFAGVKTPAMAAVAYAMALTDDMKNAGYKLATEQSENQFDYTISKNGIPVSVLRIKPAEAKGTLVVLGE